jgi:hypothetical protein
MKTLKQLREKYDAKDFEDPTDDDESKEYKPRAKGEQDFKSKHTIKKKKHPVAKDDQFDGSRKGPKGDAGEDHDGPDEKGDPIIKQGSSDIKSTHDGSKARDTSKATAGKKGETSIINPIKENVLEDLQSIAKRHQAKRVKFSNGKTEMVDAFTASAITQVYEKVNKQNQKKMAKMVESLPGFMKMMEFAMSQVGGKRR